MFFVTKASSTAMKNIYQNFFVKDMSEAPYYSKELNDRGVTKSEIFKMITLVQEDERMKIGHELHDSVNPLLALANFTLNLFLQKQKEKNSQKSKFVK